MKTLSSLIALLSIVFLSNSALASFIELRAGYGVQNIKSIENQDDNLPKHSSLSGLTADLLIIPTDFVLGVRYENLTAKKTSGSNESEAKFTRTSLVLGYRWFDTLLYMGPLATVGVVSNLEYKTRTAASSVANADKMTFGLGFEAGVHILGLLIGAEAGYLMADMGNLKDSAGDARGANGSVMSANLSGPYGRAVIGLAF